MVSDCDSGFSGADECDRWTAGRKDHATLTTTQRVLQELKSFSATPPNNTLEISVIISTGNWKRFK